MVVITGYGSAGPWGISPTPPERVEGHAAHESALDFEPAGLSPRQRRYLGRNSRLAIAACAVALEAAGYPNEPASREALACWVATGRGPTDLETTIEMIRAARRAGGTGRPVAREALATYNRRRSVVQYLMSMETAVVGHLTASFAARGPSHAVTTPGPAGGAQAIVRAVRTVSRGLAPAALACGVLTDEDPISTADLIAAAGGSRSITEGAGAILVEEAGAVAGSGRTPLASIRVEHEGLERAGIGGVGVAMPLWEIARRCSDRSFGRVRVRGFAGHRFAFDLEAIEDGS